MTRETTRQPDTPSSRHKAQERELTTLAQRIEDLKTAFDRYFMGLDRLPPLKDRDALLKLIRNSNLGSSRNTALRFQYQNVVQRMVSYNGYWERVLRMIEDGSFRRDKSSVPPPAPSVGPPVAAPATQGDPMRALFDEWTRARRETGVDPHGSVSYQQFEARMEAMQAKHRQQFGAADIDYRVRVKEGKVSLVARPLSKP